MKLTRSEFKMYMLIVGRAYSEDKLAKELGITLGSVKNVKKKIFDKMGVDSCLELLLQYHYREGEP